ncbi:hypothetical protein Tco_1546510, partial [Tanacetum coccineum]
MSGTNDENPPPPPPQETQQTVSTIKLPILKKGEYDIWAMKIEHYLAHTDYPIWEIEHYLAHTDYPIWEVIQNGNGPVSVTTDTSGQIKILPPKTGEEVVARERERKARTTLLMAIPEDHLAKFHKMTDAKEMWNAIKSRFGGNDESKKITNEVSTAHGVSNTSGHYSKHEQTTSSYSLLASQSSCPQLDHEDLDQVDEYDLEEMDLKWQVAMISMRIKKFQQQAGRRHFARECRTKEDNRRRDGWNPGNKDGSRTGKKEESRALVTVDGECVDWTAHTEDNENFAFMASNSSGSNTQSVFRCNKSDSENLPLHKRLAKTGEMQAVPPPMTGNYLPSGPDIEIDDSQYTYGPEKTQPSESESQTTKLDTCNSNISTEPSELVSEPVVNETNVEVQPKVWSDAPIIEEYESDSDDECVTVQTKGLLSLYNSSLSLSLFLFSCFSHLIRDCDYHVKLAKQVELNKQNMSKGNGTGVRKPTWNNVQRVKEVSTVGEKWVTAVKSSADCKWRTPGYYNNILSKYNGGSSLRNYSSFKDPLGRLKPKQAWGTRLTLLTFKNKQITQDVCARIQGKNSLVKHFEDMRLCRPSKEYFQ